MSTRRLEEILEECVSAYLDGRRSIEESLSLYPAVASELEPLLRTAAGVASRLSKYSPPAHVQQRGLNRFLLDARARRNLRALEMGGVRQPGVFANIWQRYRLGFVGAGVAILIAAVSLGSTTLLGDGSSNTVGQFETPKPATPAAVLNLQNAIQNIRDKGPRVQAADIDRLTQATRELRDAPPDQIASVKDTVAQNLADADSLVANIGLTQPEVAPQAQQAQETIRNVAALIGAPLPTSSTVVATATPITATPEPTAVATAEPTATETPTSEPTEAPTPSVPPAPSDSPPPRAPAGFAP